MKTYLVAVLAVAALTVTAYPLFSLFDQRFPLQYFLIGVVIASVYGGLLPGLVATVLGGIAGQFLFLPGRGQGIPTDSFDVARLLIYTSIGMIISIGSEILKRRGRQLEHALSAQGKFIANVSHELRTPLTAILGYAEVLADPGLSDAERARFIDGIARNSRLMRRLTDDVLDLARAGARRLSVHSEPVNARAVLKASWDLFSTAAKQKRLDYQIDLSVDIPSQVVTDQDRFQQIVINLLSNALKFTDDGSVVLKASVRQAPNGMRHLIVTVRDTGIGIDPAHSKDLFEPFFQADMSYARRYGGTGLGLALSWHLAGLLGGTLSLVSSKVGKGSVFEFTVPMSP